MRLRGVIYCFFLMAVCEIRDVGGQTHGLPEEITFQVYVAFDDMLHTNFSNSNLATKYASVFFNAINLMFRRMKNPKIKFEVVMFHNQFVQFTRPALTLVGEDVDAHRSLHSIYNYTLKKDQFNSSDIIFVFCGRKVFTGTGNNKDYRLQGLTWSGGICNSSRKIVIVSDAGKRFSALPNAGFQLARLLGAPTACTPGYTALMGNKVLFNLSDCAMGNITKFLREMWQNDQQRAAACFAKKYSSSISQYFKDLPNSMVPEGKFCKETELTPQVYTYTDLCSERKIAWYLNQIHDDLKRRGQPFKTGDCALECCDLKFNYNEIAYRYRGYSSFDGTPCGPKKDQICVLGKCEPKNVAT